MKRTTLFLLATLPFFTFCSPLKEPEKPPQSLILAGEVLGYDSLQHPRVVDFIFPGIFKTQQNYPVYLNEKGHFKQVVSIASTRDFLISYHKRGVYRFLGQPGDSLFFRIRYDTLERNKGNTLGLLSPSTPTIQQLSFFSQKMQKENQLLRRYQEERESYQGIVPTGIDTEEEAMKMINEREQHELSFLTKWDQEKHLSPWLKKWLTQDIYHRSLSDYLQYRLERSNEAQGDTTSSTASAEENFNRFKSRIDLPDTTELSLSKSLLLENLYAYFNAHPQDMAYQYVAFAKNQEDYKAYEVLMHMMEANTKSFLSQIMYAKLYRDMIDRFQLDVYQKLYQPELVGDERLNRQLTSMYQKAEQSTLNDYVHIDSLKNGNTRNLLDTLSKRYRGKVLYIDFWGPWCKPCIAQMPHAKALKESLKGKEVVFIYFGSLTREEPWKKAIARYDIKGEHFLLSSNQLESLAYQLNIFGYPHYTLIDRQGRIVLEKAPWPSQKEKIIREIRKLL